MGIFTSKPLHEGLNSLDTIQRERERERERVQCKHLFVLTNLADGERNEAGGWGWLALAIITQRKQKATRTEG